MTDITLTLTPTALRDRLDEIDETFAANDSGLPPAWTSFIRRTWTRLINAIDADPDDLARFDPEAATIQRLARAGFYACAAAAREEPDPFDRSAWMAAATLHQQAWTAIAKGWPTTRASRFAAPTERANLRLSANAPYLDESAERALTILLQDPIHITWAVAEPLLLVVCSGVYFTEVL